MITDNQKIDELGKMLVNRVEKNRRKIRLWATREGTTCYRLYDRDIPEIPLAIDWYEGRLHISVFERPGADPGDDWISAVVEILAKAMEVRSNDVFVKIRSRQRGGAQYEKVDRAKRRTDVGEGELRFIVNLSDYLDTGLFLDHRKTRAMVRDEARGKRFLNLFGYTGAFSVYAADGGAASTTTVDLSNTYLDWAERNMALNGFEGAEHKFWKDDILGAFEERRVKGKYDLVVIDPPTVSRSKSMARDLDIQRDHTLLLSRVLEVCSNGAIIYFSTNFRKFKMEEERIRSVKVEEISDQTVPPDFRDRKIHRCFRLVKD